MKQVQNWLLVFLKLISYIQKYGYEIEGGGGFMQTNRNTDWACSIGTSDCQVFILDTLSQCEILISTKKKDLSVEFFFISK